MRVFFCVFISSRSRGSVLVDYYLLLNGTDLDTGDIRSYFHMSLDQQGEEMKLGNFTVDPKSTDFTGTQADHGPHFISISLRPTC